MSTVSASTTALTSTAPGLTAPVLTIDGPSGSGKGTVSRLVARQLGWHLLDSGALYRLTWLAGIRAGLTATDEAGHAALAGRMAVRFDSSEDGDDHVLLDGDEVSAQIRSGRAGMGASTVALWPGVRTALLDRQRRFAERPGLVADGRDMGTVVFPTAALKIFLTASAAERAQRRYKQLKDKDSAVNLAALSLEIAERDRQDANRPISPLVPASDAVLLDSTGLSVSEVVAEIMRHCAMRGLCG
jgi:cytidylate kinase